MCNWLEKKEGEENLGVIYTTRTVQLTVPEW